MELVAIAGDSEQQGKGSIMQGGIFVAEEIDVCSDHDGNFDFAGKAGGLSWKSHTSQHFKIKQHQHRHQHVMTCP